MACQSGRSGRSYTIQSGDTLFLVAQQHLGNGDRWTEILKPDGTQFSEIDAENLQVGKKFVCQSY
jgi:nucleoid-associated protein YgaU